jgi:hypothetical protein
MAENASSSSSKLSGAAKATGAGAGAALLAVLGGLARQADDVGRIVGSGLDEIGRATVMQTDDGVRVSLNAMDDVFRSRAIRVPSPFGAGDDVVTVGDDALGAAAEAPPLGDDLGRASELGGESHSTLSEIGQQAGEEAFKRWADRDDKE